MLCKLFRITLKKDEASHCDDGNFGVIEFVALAKKRMKFVLRNDY